MYKNSVFVQFLIISMKNNQDKKENQEDQIDLAMKDEEIISLKLTRALLKKKIDAYQKETGKYAIWRGTTTESFKRYINGEKIYDRDKERISLYVSDETKEKWQDFSLFQIGLNLNPK